MMSHMGSSPLRKGGWGLCKKHPSVPFLCLAAQAYRQLQFDFYFLSHHSKTVELAHRGCKNKFAQV